MLTMNFVLAVEKFSFAKVFSRTQAGTMDGALISVIRRQRKRAVAEQRTRRNHDLQSTRQRRRGRQDLRQ